MMYGFYSIALALAVLLSSPWWLLKMLRHGKYRAGLRERLLQLRRRGSVRGRRFEGAVRRAPAMGP